jgi:polynucleotide 5'-kinase involved in rRNA processing
VEARGSSRGTRIDSDAVIVCEDEGSISELSASTASYASLPPIKTTDGERKRERRERREAKIARREEKRRAKA